MNKIFKKGVSYFISYGFNVISKPNWNINNLYIANLVMTMPEDLDYFSVEEHLKKAEIEKVNPKTNKSDFVNVNIIFFCEV